MVLENERNIVVKKEVWFALGKLKTFPERTTFSDVIAWLLEKHQEREDTKEMIK